MMLDQSFSLVCGGLAPAGDKEQTVGSWSHLGGMGSRIRRKRQNSWAGTKTV